MGMDSNRESRRGPGGRGKAGQAIGEALSSPIIPRPTETATPRHGRICGTTWCKTVRASVHQLRKPPSWAVDADDLAAAEAQGVEWLEITDTESGIVWSAPLAAFRTHGIELDRGHGEQIALPLRFWSRRKVGEPAEVSRQLALFGTGEVAP